MNREGMRDPVTAISEAEATGEIAEIFADIRATMQLPLITSIWRIIVDIEGALPAAWDATKPLYETGQPEAALKKLLNQVPLPIPEPLVPGQLECVNVSKKNLPLIRCIVDAYNRSNGMNLLALTGLIVPPSGTPANEPVPRPLDSWPKLPELLEKAEIDENTWTLLQHVNHIGMTAPGRGIATLWRHLAHWPGLLAVIHAAFVPLRRDGTIQRSMQQVRSIAQTEGARIAYLRPGKVAMPEAARRMITRYAVNPGGVVRMVTVGHGLAKWLETVDPNGF